MIKERYGFRTIFIDEKSNTYNVSEMSTEEIILSLSNKNGESYVIINGNVNVNIIILLMVFVGTNL